jgi:hypothetical protein
MTGIYNTMGLVAVVSLTATLLHFVATRAMGAISMASRAGLDARVLLEKGMATDFGKAAPELMAMAFEFGTEYVVKFV